VPALLARGDLDLRVKQQSITGFDLKLTPMPECHIPTILEVHLTGFDMNRNVDRNSKRIQIIDSETTLT
jgi:hypothetical protein